MDEDLFSDSSNKSRSSDEENSVIDDSDRDRNYDSEKDSAESSSSEESKEEKLQSKIAQRKEAAKNVPAIRRRKELENIELHVIHELRQASYVRKVLQIAKDSLENEDCLPIVLGDFTRLRDVLILVLIISSLKRVMEFMEFRLCEFLERELKRTPSGETCYVIRIARHKTAEAGASVLFIDEDEEKALLAYVKHYRPIAVPCSGPHCYMFPTRNNMKRGCCSRMEFPNVNRILQSVSKKAASDCKITSRILRRSQITALWEKCEDPSWKQKVANLVGHSLATASRYYEFSEKVPPGLAVFETLKRMKQEGWRRLPEVERSVVSAISFASSDSESEAKQTARPTPTRKLELNKKESVTKKCTS
ncbi:hypothetical protein E2C01_044932 [Portunus trituberculatus]|uniref:Uncharacterized protein n=1 Tax=Portunus trituberculatus TaxID=210409 RepID=A0A5B7G3P0_PORTR|nr:hypothetical protein [Portunus trituberculatus]